MCGADSDIGSKNVIINWFASLANSDILGFNPYI